MEYRLYLTDKAEDDIAMHKKTGNKAILNKLFTLLQELTEHPFIGTGKPEPLQYNLSGMWSRRINREHRLVYEVEENFCIRTLGKRALLNLTIATRLNDE